jgi:PAS domain S-box-containing protein
MTRDDWRSLVVSRGRLLGRISCPMCLLALAISAAVALIGFAAIELDRNRTEQAAQLAGNYLAELARQRTTDLFVQVDGGLRSLATAAAAPDPDRAVRGARLAALLAERRRAEPGLLALFVIGSDGDMLAASLAPTLRAGGLLPSCLQDEKVAPDQAVLKPIIAGGAGDSAGTHVICFAEGYRLPGFTGVILAVLDEELIRAQYGDLHAGAHGVITLRDETGRVLARAWSDTDADEAMPTTTAAGGIERMRRIDVPVAATVTVSISEADVLAGWRARSALIGSSAVLVVAFIWLAALAVRGCLRREAMRLERLTALSHDLRGTADRDTLTRRLIEVASELVPVISVPAPEDSKPPVGVPERRWGLTVLRPDLVRIGTVTLQGRDGMTFSDSDLAVLRVLARIAESAIHGATALSAAHDNAERLREELDRICQSLATMQLEMSDAVFALDADWRFTTANRNAERLFGEYHEDLRDHTIWERFPELVGTVFEAECRRAVREQHEVSFELHWLRSDLWLTVHAFPHRSGLAVYLQDISRLVAANDKLRTAAKMEAIGRLTGGIAHDFNNMLTVILGNIEALEYEPTDDPDTREIYAAIKRAANNAAKLTHQLLAFARRQPLSPEDVDVGRRVVGLDGLLKRTLGEVIALEIHCPVSLWLAHVDPDQLDNAIVNLAINARDAMPAGGRLTIEAANLSMRKAEEDPYGEIKPGNYVVISVSDTGRGIPKELLGNVFEPFFSTKPHGRGTGLGLAMVYGFVNQSGGHAKITSEVGRGTTVRLYLPSSGEGRAELYEPAAPRAVRALEPGSPGGNETLLVVEDDPMVRETTRKMLADLGYRVTTAGDGPEALSLLERGLAPDLLLTDVLLPGGLDGLRLAEQVLQRRPGTRVLYMSGYVENVDAYQGQLDPQTNLLPKPFARAALAIRVRARLDQDRDRPGQNISAA